MTERKLQRALPLVSICNWVQLVFPGLAEITAKWQYSDSTKWLCIQELGTDLVFLRLWPQVKFFRMEKPSNFIALYVHQNGEKFQNSILSQEENLRQRTYLNILLIFSFTSQQVAWFTIFSVYPHLHWFISSALVFPELLKFSMICLFN